MDNGFISTKLIGALDYITGIILIASPWLFGYYNISSAALFIPVFLGAMQIIMAIFSNYELGIMKVLPMPLHSFLNGFVGFWLLVSPFLYGFCNIVFWPQVILGILLLMMAIYAKPSPAYEERKF
ncbi:SPW repeat domain-containing protein [Mucilaginibacter jinjuensis]|uniref:SPW repeat-containing integral membrane domain-containing protein n=1 Tax=Mucilaginibacter jinjuensis TaxID=1176721 RepID=A0ABY7T1W0_9SPHI|nr:hypothetical protein [Mucilaginibacter jinjuensis]WCT10248.1 hypothetical protein PQO05_16045 [Mucilaginibacter jinjuensis]